jgi:hydroxymethylpyrimidine pyrophosphatase-like HAD family hydrolase
MEKGGPIMKFKLIASDLDDTLLDGQGFISPRTKEAIKKAREKGVYVTLATGRM